MIAKRVGKIVEQCIRITQNTPHDVFARYSGHVNQIDIDAHIGGWEKGGPCQSIGCAYLEKSNAMEALLKIERQLSYLECGSSADDYDDMERVG